MQNILFVGKSFPRSLLQVVSKQSKGKIGFSNHNFENSLIHGFALQDNVRLSLVLAPGVFSFPHNNTSIYTRSETYADSGVDVHSCGFCNLLVINKIWKLLSLQRSIKQVLKCHEDERVNIIIDTADYELIKAVEMARQGFEENSSVIVIIPDIPSMITSLDSYNPLKKWLVQYFDNEAQRLASESDYLVLLTEQMMDFIYKPVKHIVMEGLVDVESMSSIKTEPLKNDKDVILYTGTLRKQFGVLNLLEAFQRMKTKRDVELWICGSGDSAYIIASAANKDSRIKFYGLVNSQKALELQRQATILVNPRTSDGEYTKYSFPSKTMEYLLSGRNVVINRLPGIPEEYFEYAFCPQNESIDAMTEILDEVVAMPIEKRQAVADAGRQFVINKKNAIVQTKRILDLIFSQSKS